MQYVATADITFPPLLQHLVVALNSVDRLASCGVLFQILDFMMTALRPIEASYKCQVPFILFFFFYTKLKWEMALFHFGLQPEELG